MANVGMGYQIMNSLTTGSQNAGFGDIVLQSLTTGNLNTGMGYGALRSLTTGSGNIGLGYHSGYTNTDSNALTTASYNTFVGYESGFGNSTQYNNTIAIGYRAKTQGENSIAIGKNVLANGSNILNIGNLLYGNLSSHLWLDTNKKFTFGGSISNPNASIYWDGTNLIFNTNATGTGLAWFSKNVSATGYITRTSVYDKTKGGALNYIKDSDTYKSGNEINHSKFYGYTRYQVADFSRPVYINTTEEICGSGGGVITCKNITAVETTYPYTKTEEGVMLDKEIDVLRQAVYEENEKVKMQDSQIQNLQNKLDKICSKPKYADLCV